MSWLTNMSADDLRSLGAIAGGAALTIGHQLRLGRKVKEVKTLAEPTGNGWAQATTDTLTQISGNLETLTGRVTDLEAAYGWNSDQGTDDTGGPF